MLAAEGPAIELLLAETLVEDEWIVRTDNAEELAAEFRVASANRPGPSNNMEAEILRPVAGENQFLVVTRSDVSSGSLQWLRSLSSVIAVESNQVVYAAEASPPSDPRFSEQYALLNDGQEGGLPGADIRARDAWESALTKTGSVGSRSLVTAVVDSGVDYAHPDLYLNIWINQGEIPPAFRDQITHVDDDGLITFVELNDSRNSRFVVERADDDNDFIDAGDLLADPNWMNGVDDDEFTQLECDTSEQRCDFTDDLFGWDFLEDDNNPFHRDDHSSGESGTSVRSGHGTHVAGTIGAIGNGVGRDDGAAELGVAGLNWSTSMLPIRILDSNNRGTLADSADALAYLNLIKRTGRVDLRVVNNSWGVRDFSRVLETQVDASEEHGVLLVAAAGNGDFFGDGLNIDRSPVFPAAYDNPHLISVAASDRFDELARFSNYSATSVDIAAPGARILSTEPGGQFGFRSGTSMAAPHVSGTAALLWSMFAEATNLEIRSAILRSATPLDALENTVKTGGRLNAGGALGSDHFSPIAEVVLAGDVNQQSSDEEYFVEVRYRDQSPIDLGTFGDANIVVREFLTTETSLSVQFVGFVGDTSNDRERTARYRVTPPGGKWDAFDSGGYEIFLGELRDRVSDDLGNLAGEGRQSLLTVFSVIRNITPLGEVFNVDILNDSVDLVPGDGICRDEQSKCSLRAAVMEANELPGIQTIRLGEGSHKLSIERDFSVDGSGVLNIEEEVIILGAGREQTEIDAQHLMEVFDVHQSAGHVTLADLSIVNGFNDFLGGASIETDADLSLLSISFSGHATQPGSERMSGIYGFNGNAKRLFSSSGPGVRASGATGDGYLMYSSGLTSQRFSFQDVHAKVVAVQHRNNQWFVWSGEQAPQWIAFDPDGDDRLLARVNFSSPDLGIQSLLGQSGVFEGIEIGYVESDLRFVANHFDGESSEGDIDVLGVFFSTQEMPEIRIVNSVFSGNGGVASIDVWGFKTTIEASEFSFNSVGEAAVSVQTGYVASRGSGFQNNEGGAIYLHSVVADIAESFFDQNLNEFSGGAIHSRDSFLGIDGSFFSHNHSLAHGGGIYATNSSTKILNSEFAFNQSPDPEPDDILSGGLGGGVFLDSQPYLDGVEIVNSGFVGNRAKSGAGIFIGFDTAQTRLEKLEVSENIATGGGGGGIYINGETLLIDSRVIGNQAENDGGIRGFSGDSFFNDDLLILENSTIVNNTGESGPSNVSSGLEIISRGNNVVGTRTDVSGRSKSDASQLAGRVFNDANNNGRADEDELPIVGATVYIDVNENGELDSGEPLSLSDLSGVYLFSGLETGRPFTIAVDGQAGFVQTLPDPDDETAPRSLRGKRQVTLGQNDTVSNQDFGFHSIVAGQSGVGTIRGRVFDDANGNGEHDAGEPGIAGVRVFLDELIENGVFDPGESFTFTQIADPNAGVLLGEYILDGVTPGNVRLIVEPPASKSLSSPRSNSLRLDTKLDMLGFRDPQDLIPLELGNNQTAYVVSDRDANRNQVVLLTEDGEGGFQTDVLPGVFHTPGTITAAKLNQHERLDLVVSNEGSPFVSLFESRADGSFSQTTLNAGLLQVFVSAYDVDANGLDDVFVARKKGISAGKDPAVEYFRNLGDGRFSAPIALPDLPLDVPAHLLHADVMGDSTKELIVTGWTVDDADFDPRQLAIYQWVNGDYQLAASYRLPAAVNPLFTVARDLNDDQLMDLAIADTGADLVFVLLNDSSQKGEFCESGVCERSELQILQGVLSPTSLQVVDVDNDGDEDLVAAIQEDENGTLAVLRNLGDGNFDSIPTTFGTAPLSQVRYLTRSFVSIADESGKPTEFLVPQDGTLSILSNTLESGSYQFTVRADDTVFNRDFGLAEIILDDQPPTSEVETLPAALTTSEFTVRWSGSDGVNGSGIVSYDLFVSTNDGGYQKILSETTSTRFEFSGETGNSYAFYTIARDASGNEELPPNQPDATTRVVVSLWQNPVNVFDVNNQNGTTAGDALAIINELARRSVSDRETGQLLQVPPDGFGPLYFDVNADGNASALDALLVINALARLGGSGDLLQGESESRGAPLSVSDDVALPLPEEHVGKACLFHQSADSESEGLRRHVPLPDEESRVEIPDDALDATISLLADDVSRLL